MNHWMNHDIFNEPLNEAWYFIWPKFPYSSRKLIQGLETWNFRKMATAHADSSSDSDVAFSFDAEIQREEEEDKKVELYFKHFRQMRNAHMYSTYSLIGNFIPTSGIPAYILYVHFFVVQITDREPAGEPTVLSEILCQSLVSLPTYVHFLRSSVLSPAFCPTTKNRWLSNVFLF